jgi:hypothetical protein
MVVVLFIMLALLPGSAVFLVAEYPIAG